MKILFLVVVGVFVVWSLWGLLASRVEQASYTVLSKKRGYEVRSYAPHIEAQTVVSGASDRAMGEGFTIIAGYIFGGNTSKTSIAMTAPVGSVEASSEKIAMTAPVVSTKVASEKIAMTAPVVATENAGAYVVSFIMPRSYTLETLPTPNDARVQLVAVPERKVAALRYRGYRSTSGIETMKAELLGLLERDGEVVVGTPSYAGYNAPGTPPWLSRHEILVEIK